MSITTTRERFLIDAATLDDKEVLYIYPRGDLSQATALAALDAQFGKGEFDAWQHGSALRISRRVFRHHGETYRRFSEANEYLWAARAEGLPKEEIDRRREALKEPQKIWDDMFERTRSALTRPLRPDEPAMSSHQRSTTGD